MWRNTVVFPFILEAEDDRSLCHSEFMDEGRDIRGRLTVL